MSIINSFMRTIKKKKYKQVKIQYFLNRLYAELKNNPEMFIICKLKSIHGDCDYEKIRLDYRKDIYSTLIHEYLHYMFPDLSETMVLKEEVRIINKMTMRQIKNLIKIFSDIL